ncbi:hypothetical protein XENOCAPTIV_016277 [Xenoophorus captivus]|uniref:C2H2-type domain-containing protein n=1 Tax=Xenoophorus captivus TaxID=1517983 RepID=A0ABV0RHN0_9TELE
MWIKGSELPVKINAGDKSIRIQDHGDGSISLETEKDVEDDDVKQKNVEPPRKVQTGVKFSCEDCGKTLIRKCTLNMHKRIHTGQKPSCCDLCGLRFSYKSSLNTHENPHWTETIRL